MFQVRRGAGAEAEPECFVLALGFVTAWDEAGAEGLTAGYDLVQKDRDDDGDTIVQQSRCTEPGDDVAVPNRKPLAPGL